MFGQLYFIGLRTTLLVVLSIVMMYLDHRQDMFRPLHSALSLVTTPVQYAVNWPVNMVSWLGSSLSSHQELIAENSDLRANLLLLNGKLQRIIALESENAQLRALLKSSSNVGGKVSASQLLAVDVSPFLHQVVLDQGRQQGIYLGQPVLDAYGVMGQVVQVRPWTSRVLLLTSTMSSIPVQDARNGIRAIAVGTGSTTSLRIVDVPATMDIQQGDLFVTSGLGLRFPVGYPVGVVSQIEHDPGKPFLNIELTVSARMNRSRQVLMVWPDESTQQLALEHSQTDSAMELDDPVIHLVDEPKEDAYGGSDESGEL